MSTCHCVEVCVEVKCVHVSLCRSVCRGEVSTCVEVCVEVKCVHVSLCRSVCRGEVCVEVKCVHVGRGEVCPRV